MNELAPCPSQPCQPIPSGLVSLWDMLEFCANDFIDVLKTLQSVETLVDHKVGGDPNRLIPNESMAFVNENLGLLRAQCNELGAVISADFVGDALMAVERGSCTWEEFARRTKLIYEVLRKELGRSLLFSVSSDKLSYFNDAMFKFDPDAYFAFESCGDDIDEAGKCFALGRYTACVFHLMRVLERPIISLAKILLPDDPVPNWGTVLNKIDTELKKKPSERSFKGDVQFFSEVAAEMRSVQHAWRNRVMHIDQLITEERAKSIFDATIGFMNAVSKKIDENGLIDPNLSLDLETPPQP